MLCRIGVRAGDSIDTADIDWCLGVDGASVVIVVSVVVVVIVVSVAMGPPSDSGSAEGVAATGVDSVIGESSEPARSESPCSFSQRRIVVAETCMP